MKVLIIFGTRPEAIKMASLIKEFNKCVQIETRVCITAQHREMLDGVLDFFSIKADYDLDLMKPNQNLYNLTSEIISSLKLVLEDFNPDYVFVHGDTTTSMAASLASFYHGSKVCHVEAGLRTFDVTSPFPEEMNRQITSRIAYYHFAPTILAKSNLLNENISEEKILITGNTVIDALYYTAEVVNDANTIEIQNLKNVINFSKKIILVTGHRRENHGEGFLNICSALKKVAETFDDVEIVYPVHLNPNVKDIVYKELSDLTNVKLITPLSYSSFVWLMNKSFLILTDSGGIQEEAPSLGKPVLLMRNTSERPEAIDAGTVILVGTDKGKIFSEISDLLTNRQRYLKMGKLQNPYGDGKSAKRIVDFIKSI